MQIKNRLKRIADMLEKIGVASCDIKAGDYVHTHNLKPVGHLQEA